MNKTNKTLVAAALVASMSVASSAALADSAAFTGATKDAWLTGKVETAFVLNAHLNPFAITTDVDDGVVRLSGVVKDDIDRDLAAEVARGIDGVVRVENELTIDADRAVEARERAANRRDFGSWVDDATTTAVVKSKLVGNSNTSGLKIDVDTRDDVVTLSGRVGSKAESDLAEQLALNTGDVKQVRNNLVVDRT